MIVYTSTFLLAESAAARPLSRARIGWQTHARDLGLGAAAVTVSSEDADGPRDAPLRFETAEYWLPTALPATWTLDLGTGFNLDYVGIAAHTIGSNGCSAKIETSSDGSTWTLFAAEVSPGDDAPILYLDDSRANVRYIKLTLAGVGDPPKVGVIYAGEVLAMQYGVSAGYSPLPRSRQTELRQTLSRGGQLLGQAFRKLGVKSQARFRFLDVDWYLTNFEPFVKSARRYPFFFAWNPQDFPLQVGYAWATKDIAPQYMNADPWFQVAIDMVGLGND